ncbi:tRNA methyltransferase complex GCD14 subunit [Artomyces pyxidatus]|uniref:tRNA methyltransferase complex GCD14 subunit n=1 Tax=Artomyces pyxidatus TaxID=48021 RepID=A0ACB8T6I5_9AGAM|nr:tRNA methyltransferase complex GCD14 subunit [Artomyces pyxidatus]
MWSSAREIAAGDVVIVWLTRDAIQSLVVTPGKDFNSRYGNYRHSDLIGLPYGSKVRSRNGSGFIHVLRPTPELWTLALPHRTQILYLADIAFITSWLDVRPGSCVIEAVINFRAGSGGGLVMLDSMTGALGCYPSHEHCIPVGHNIAAAYPMSGRGLYSTIRTMLRCSPKSTSLLIQSTYNGIDKAPDGTGSGSFTHSIARTVGPAGRIHSYEFHEARASKATEEFARHGMTDVVSLTHRNVCKDGFAVADAADAVFLDLPSPWEAVEHAKRALRKDRTTRICCFSPCIEQVLRTVSALNDSGFTDVTMYETLLRPHEVNAIPALTPIGAVSDKLKEAARVREEKRLRQIANARAKRKRDDPVPEEGGVKKAKTEERDEGGVNPDGGAEVDVDVEMPLAVPDPDADAAPPSPPALQVVSKVVQEVRGHTSYLTFARLLPATGTITPAPS